MRQLYRLKKEKARKYYQVMFRHIPGRWISTGAETLADAVKFAEDKLGRDLSARRPDDDITFGIYVKDFFDIEKDPHGFIARQVKRGRVFSSLYYKTRTAYLNNYFVPIWGDQLISSISDIQVEDAVLDMKRVDGEEPSNNYKNKALAMLKDVFQEAKREGYVSDNPAMNVKELNDSTANPRKPFLSQELERMFPEDNDSLLRIWDGLMWAVYFLVMRDTGFRPGEVAGLKVSNYLPTLHGIYTKQAVNSMTKTIQLRIKTTGKGYDYKTGVLTEQTEYLLKLHIATIPPERELLFMVNGNIVTTSTSNKHLMLSLKRAGVDPAGRTQYSLRHSFETDIAGRVEDKVLLELMAHTGYRAEYDHRSPEVILQQLQPVRQILEQRTHGELRQLKN